MFRRYRAALLCILIISLNFTGCGLDLPPEVDAAKASLPDRVDFNLHVRPILSDRCWACHGPDNAARKADLHLHTSEGAFEMLRDSSGYAFVSGSTKESVALQRMISDDPEFRMPPPKSNLNLTPREIAMLARWVEQGAEWKPHWAFIPPEKPDVPDAATRNWVQHNAIDAFIQRQLKLEKLAPAEEAGKERLLRRVYMDLTGLPPDVVAIDAFLADSSDRALEKVVDALLQSDAWAERMAMEWMDIARYADSHGLHADGYRMMWPWRDWVIKAFRKNMPYDQFITLQLAGDLLPDAGREEILATAFHRNHPMTAEGGVVDEEFRLEYVFDRTNTTATALMGMTMRCARCHDHKFDPISQDEYYQMTAFFNNVKELGMTGDDGNYGPMLMLPDSATDAQLKKLDGEIAVLKSEMVAAKSSFVRKLSKRQLSTPPKLPSPVKRLRFDRLAARKGKNASGFWVDRDSSLTASEGITLERGKFGRAARFNDEYDQISIKNAGLFEVHDIFSAGVWFKTNQRDSAKYQTFFGNSGNKNNFWRGWEFYLDPENRPNVRLIHSLPHNYLHVRASEEVELDKWAHAGMSYDGSGEATGVGIFINGRALATETVYDRLYKSIYPVTNAGHEPEKRALRFGRSGRAFTGENGIFSGLMDDFRLFDRRLSAVDFARIAGVRLSQLDKAAFAQARYINSPAAKNLDQRLKALKRQRFQLLADVPEVMVMEEMAQQRPAHVLNRGQYDAPQHVVLAGTPESILAFPDSLPPNRLGLSKWLFSDAHPLTARVTVNRYWQLFFGRGLVKTPEDFGSQGALPSHPELLDWLAVEFREKNWDVRHLQKLIVMSNTYRQSSRTAPATRERDPENILLARGPSYRLPAEMIRDNALAASGLLVQKVGGRSVKPYQPDGLWIDLGNFSHKLLHYKADSLDNLYRRSMYTFIRRTSPPPFMTTFDAPNRDVCTVQRERTNTPLQALVLLNDPQFVEASRVLAERMQQHDSSSLDNQIRFAFRCATGRRPNSSEIDLLKGLFAQEKARLAENPVMVDSLLSVGHYKHPDSLHTPQTAALALVANTILNHDEAYMKR